METNSKKLIFNNEGYRVIGERIGPEKRQHYVVYSD